MLTTEQIREHLTHLSYKPGWSFEVYDGRWEGQHIAIRGEVEDSYRPGEKTVLDVHSMLPPMTGTGALEAWLIWRLCRLEVHEAREFFKRDGRVLFDPHAPFADRDVA